MTYIHTPMGNEIPDASSLQRIMGAFETAKDAHVLLHCTDSSRVGAIWALYAGKRDSLPVEKAIAEGKMVGMNTLALEAAVREVLSKDQLRICMDPWKSAVEIFLSFIFLQLPAIQSRRL